MITFHTMEIDMVIQMVSENRYIQKLPFIKTLMPIIFSAFHGGSNFGFNNGYGYGYPNG